jgi:hypothetical protein
MKPLRPTSSNAPIACESNTRSRMESVEEDASIRQPASTPDDVVAAEAAEAALPSRKRPEAQLRRSFAPPTAHLSNEIKRERRRFVQQGQRAWNGANPSPPTWELERTLTAGFMKIYEHGSRGANEPAGATPPRSS